MAGLITGFTTCGDAYDSIGGQLHTRFLSPWTSSIRPTLGQSLVSAPTNGYFGNKTNILNLHCLPFLVLNVFILMGHHINHVQLTAGNAPSSLEYGLSHFESKTWVSVWGASLRGFLSLSILPSSISLISSRMQIIASQNLSSSALGSDSVGSTIKHPVTGHDLLNNKSMI